MLRGVSEDPFLGLMRDGEQGLTVIETEWVPRLSWILTYQPVHIQSRAQHSKSTARRLVCFHPENGIFNLGLISVPLCHAK